MEVFNDLTIYNRDRLATRDGGIIGVYLSAGEVNFRLRRRKDLICNLKLRGMDQGFSIHAPIAPLKAFGMKTIFILEGVINPINTNNPMGARGHEAGLQREMHRASGARS